MRTYKKFEVVISRTYEKTQTTGFIVCRGDDKVVYAAMTLEPVNNGNKKGGCIPEGSYPVKREYSPAFKRKLLEVKNVPSRSEIKFHELNFARQSLGCIGLGLIHADINKDSVNDIKYSKPAIEAFEEICPDEFMLHIM